MVRELNGAEAELLCIYFEEIGAYQHKQNKKMKRDSGGGYEAREHVVQDLTDYDDWNDEDYTVEEDD